MAKSPAKPARLTEAKSIAARKRDPKFDGKPLMKKGKSESKLNLAGGRKAKGKD